MSVYANLWARALAKDIIQGHPSQEKEKALYKHIIQELPSSGRVGVASGSRRGRVDARRSRSRSRPKQDVRLWPQGGATGLATVVKDVSKDKGNCDTNADASGT